MVCKFTSLKKLFDAIYMYEDGYTHHIKYITDINECQFNNGHCGHHCTNTNGSYYCTCNPGYKLTNNKHSCVGMYLFTYVSNCVS